MRSAVEAKAVETQAAVIVVDLGEAGAQWEGALGGPCHIVIASCAG